mmetsp:Transcript_3544/g.4245  ORF Transcript_3544/g.4245 Transcript_3544/m.4245 type:complete len:152 (+) Transcript_3544:59-514(+)|eukprot:CAMPEP_0195316606 /NCGR_PEP_ID=MMETSP0708-20121125/3711_1 /TAXON_ID=33640 /ORGANISM="Asterionellopsis glacialis, Strain CCMP134" /LENGTH=151 /DNA_ID=CAMNT_0040382063 /DNA_START=59 /DNA_END=514 /DNA_ORIENTATION=+
MTTLNSAIQEGLLYLRENAWSILGLLIVLFYAKSKFLEPALYNRQNSRDQNSDRTMRMREEMMKVRLEQQEEANKKAIEAKRIREERERKEQTRRNESPTNADKKKKKKPLKPIGSSSSSRLQDGGGYNPLQPWSSNSSGYRPARRQTRRG